MGVEATPGAADRGISRRCQLVPCMGYAAIGGDPAGNSLSRMTVRPTPTSRPVPTSASPVPANEAPGTVRVGEATLRDILHGMLEGFQLLGHDWRFLFVNDVVCEHGRRTREELVGCTIMDVYPGIDETPMFAALRRCMEERRAQRLENEFTYPDGTTRWFDLSIQPAPEGIFVLSTDVTERKEAELSVARQVQQLQALRSIDLAILGSHDLSLMLNVVVSESIRALGVVAARVLLLPPRSSMLVTSVQQGFLGSVAPSPNVRLGAGMAGRAAALRRTIVVPDLRESRDAEGSLAFESGAFITGGATPLIAKGEVRGVLEVYGRERLTPGRDWLDFLEALAGQAAIAIESAAAFEDLQAVNTDLRLAQEATIEGWSRAMDLRDHETEGHTLRVTDMTLQLARAAGTSEPELVHVRRGALLHDIGKLGVPDHVLFKPGPLTDDEWALMRKHPDYAYEMLLPISYLRPALDIPYCHHERWDGSGYPRGLRGEAIPRAARLFAVVDVWDALRSDRPYRGAWPEERVLDHIRSRAGSDFDPEAVEMFLEVVRAGVRDFQPVIGEAW